jgi:serine-type D-Ala-D-Ala carboxypeptidase (penicillin-binding protein 5/6)
LIETKTKSMRRRLYLNANDSWIFFVCLSLVVTTPLRLIADWKDDIKSLIDSHEGEVAVAIKNLDTQESYAHRADAVQATASLIKFPILIELYRQSEAGKVSLDEMVTLEGKDKVPGSGVLTDHFPDGTQVSLGGIARLMIAFSDNTATNLVLDETGISGVTATMVDMGFPETQVHSKVYRREESIAPDRSEKYGLGSTTAQDMIRLFQMLHERKLVSEDSSNAMLKHLAACDDATKFLRFLPKFTKAFHKTGAVANVRTDAGLLPTSKGTIAFAVLTTKNKDASWGDTNAAEILCGKIGEIVYKEFNPPKKANAEPKEPSALAIGASGEMVEALQRALNRELMPDKPLTIDGDFGAMTATALKAFQRKAGLEDNGIADQATWKKLGAIQFEEESVPKPEVINTESLKLEAADVNAGAPFVSCKAWLIADGESGKILDSHQAKEKLDIASTTKVMTAWLVCKLAQKSPSILDETITFSKRADDTIGSTSAIRAGESLSVREAMYGLMLPSGNDASIAFAEHFGHRLASVEKNFENETDTEPDAVKQFVKAMNEEAKALGMAATHFENPHGLTSKGHQSTCEDLLKLVRTALSSPLLREVVGTRQRGCQVTGATGYQRNVLWKNTNQLLGTEGYFGMKTGTTDAAGACLISCSRRENQTRIVIVLGSSGSAARYSDSRNLHRWGWQLKDNP